MLTGANSNTVKEKNSFPLIYEIVVWLLYTGMFKYAYYADEIKSSGDPKSYFPHMQLILYAVFLTLYTIPFYRWLFPYFLNAKKYGRLIIATLLFFFIVPKFSNWLGAYIFLQLNPGGVLHDFYATELYYYRQQATHIFGWDIRILFTDLIAFSSVAFVSYAFYNEQKKRLLERDNFSLQLESLKAQLNPHFLFNVLNSIYGMSIIGAKETPQFILRLSEMMRYILYDCQQSKVPVKKDIEFLQHYFEMEKIRYPNASIDFTTTDTVDDNLLIAPLLLIPFVENSFKHGAHRLNDTGFVKAGLQVLKNELHFAISNDVFAVTTMEQKYGGVGIENVKKRLQLYYPGKHQLQLVNDKLTYSVQLVIQLN